ncbi:hypothetical protein [Spirillospora sp. NPDC048819]|uniref:hypothetical protein n=1 Tax=Spirillospora sp. NPDC048819 TaxID=3155268 RepID=UPI0033FE9C6D
MSSGDQSALARYRREGKDGQVEKAVQPFVKKLGGGEVELLPPVTVERDQPPGGIVVHRQPPARLPAGEHTPQPCLRMRRCEPLLLGLDVEAVITAARDEKAEYACKRARTGLGDQRDIVLGKGTGWKRRLPARGPLILDDLKGSGQSSPGLPKSGDRRNGIAHSTPSGYRSGLMRSRMAR